MNLEDIMQSEITRHKKDKYFYLFYLFYLSKVTKIGKFREIESRIEVTRAVGRGIWDHCLMTISFWYNEKCSGSGWW
jgi:hypothetical protein